MKDDLISKASAIDIVRFECGEWEGLAKTIIKRFEQLPSVQPEIIRCNSCKHWTQSTGKMKGYGLGRCDFHDVDLVTCNGFCYWAERRTDERYNQQTGGD